VSQPAHLLGPITKIFLNRTAEINIAIICACMTTLSPFITRSKLLGADFLASLWSSLRSRKLTEQHRRSYAHSITRDFSDSGQLPLSMVNRELDPPQPTSSNFLGFGSRPNFETGPQCLQNPSLSKTMKLMAPSR
jgi:hypothetical protein